MFVLSTRVRQAVDALVAALLVGVLGHGLAGCEAGSLFAGLGSPLTSEPVPLGGQARKRWTMVALAPLMGVPDTVSQHFIRPLTQSALKQQIVMRGDPDAKTEYTLRGYIVVERDKTGSKISYVWDVLDAKGAKINSVKGEQALDSPPEVTDKWAPVSTAVMQIMADKAVAGITAAMNPAAAPAAVAPN